MATVITGSGVMFASVLAQRGALRLEMQGLRHSRGSIYAMLKRHYGFKGNKQKVMQAFEDLIETTYGPLTQRYTERTN